MEGLVYFLVWRTDFWVFLKMSLEWNYFFVIVYNVVLADIIRYLFETRANVDKNEFLNVFVYIVYSKIKKVSFFSKKFRDLPDQFLWWS